MFYSSMASGSFNNDIGTAEAVAAQGAAREASTKADLLAHDIDRLLLITEAMWTLMKQEHGYADDVLTKLIEEIESKRVVMDGVTVKDPPQPCPSCGKINSANRMFCIYCGKPILTRPFAH